MEREGEEGKAGGFLSDGRSDPRPELLRRLRSSLREQGSIVAYNASFEKTILEQSTAAYPEYASWWRAQEHRLVDLYAPFRSFDYYHPSQLGSTSIKAVLPALTGASYAGLSIGDGAAASREFARITFGDVEEKERVAVRRELERYCATDTAAMRDIVAALRSIVREGG